MSKISSTPDSNAAGRSTSPNRVKAGLQLQARIEAIVETVLAFYATDGVLAEDDFEAVVADIVTDVYPLLTEPAEAKALADLVAVKFGSMAVGGAR